MLKKRNDYIKLWVVRTTAIYSKETQIDLFSLRHFDRKQIKINIKWVISPLYFKAKRFKAKFYSEFLMASLQFPYVNEAVAITDLIPKPNLFNMNGLRNDKFFYSKLDCLNNISKAICDLVLQLFSEGVKMSSIYGSFISFQCDFLQKHFL